MYMLVTSWLIRIECWYLRRGSGSIAHIDSNQCMHSWSHMCSSILLHVLHMHIKYWMHCICLYTHSFAVQNFNYSPHWTACPMLALWQEQVDIMLVEQMWQPRPAGEKQRVRKGNINGGIKWWWQQKMAARSDMVLMDLFAARGGGDREMVCQRKSLYDTLSSLCLSGWVALTWDLLYVITSVTLCNHIPSLCIRGDACHYGTTDTWFFFRDCILTFSSRNFLLFANRSRFSSQTQAAWILTCFISEENSLLFPKPQVLFSPISSNFSLISSIAEGCSVVNNSQL